MSKDSAVKYYQDNKEKLQKDIVKDISKYGHKQYKNLPEDEDRT